MLEHLGEPVRSPPVAPAWVAEDGLMMEDIDPCAQPMPDYNFDQRVSW